MGAGTRGVLTIGALSAATGVNIETLRTWERRYGFPAADRKPSGHRVYALSTVPRLRLIAQLVARGHRPAEVMAASERTLEALLATEAAPAAPPERNAAQRADGTAPAAAPRASRQNPNPVLPSPRDFSELLEAARLFATEKLRSAFQAEWARLGPVEFAEGFAAPLLNEVGGAWAKGELEVRHEHFVSAALGDFLRAARAPLDARASGPIAALATLSDEQHALGVQLCAVIFSLAGWRPLVLGADTPIDQIVALSGEAEVAAVGISRVLPHDAAYGRTIRSLRRRLPRTIPLLLGGAGATPKLNGPGIEVIRDLRGLDAWVRARADHVPS